jgi:hypothetical protein
MNVIKTLEAMKARRTGGEGQENDRDPQVLSVVPQTDDPSPPDDYSITENILKSSKSDNIIQASQRKS